MVDFSPQGAQTRALAQLVRRSAPVLARSKPPQPAVSSPGAPVAQLADLEIGRAPLVNKMYVGMHFAADDIYRWPAPPAPAAFDPASYGGAVARAMTWGLTAGEGTAGWFTREYTPMGFNAIAQDAAFASTGLEATPALNNEANKTLVATRAFRGGVTGDMAAQTATDLAAILASMNAQRAALHAAGLIADPLDTVAEVKADPAEAHPNTLPTAKVTFTGGERLYFKGRSGAVEDALVGTANSAAREVSTLSAHPAPARVGTHAFLTDPGGTHVAADVGPAAVAPPASVTEAEHGWLAAARTAAIVALSGTSDLHASNVLTGASGKKHVIDAEFLLDATAWDSYAAAAGAGELVNFSVLAMAPEPLKVFTRGLSTVQKLQLGDTVAAAFNAQNLQTDVIQEQVLAPIRALLLNDARLRVSPEPFITSFWLRSITDHHNAATDAERDAAIGAIWNVMVEVYAGLHVDLDPAQAAAARAMLAANFTEGRVPLFHVSAQDGAFYLNRNTRIGLMRADRQAAAFLTLTKSMLVAAYPKLLLAIRAAIIDA
jgi:hypothetical protein